MDTITISKEELKSALEQWEIAYREGKTMTNEEVLKLPVGEVSDIGGEFLWTLLTQEQATA